MKIQIFVTACLLLCTVCAAAEFNQPFMLKDISEGTTSSQPQQITAVGNMLYFTARNTSGYYELWRTDGTEAETTVTSNRAINIFPTNSRNAASLGDEYLLYSGFAVEGSELLGVELLLASNSSTGSMIVKDIYPGFDSSRPKNFIPAGSRAYFIANDGNGNRWWVSDGTDDGTTMVPQQHGLIQTPYYAWDSFDGRLLYYLDGSGSSTYELWISDGSEEGTQKLADLPGFVKFINMGSSIAYVMVLTPDSFPQEVSFWRTDGTPAGTYAVVSPPELEAESSWFATVSDRAVFTATASGSWGTWVNDGTMASTLRIDGEGGTFFSPAKSGVYLYAFDAPGGLGYLSGNANAVEILSSDFLPYPNESERASSKLPFGVQVGNTFVGTGRKPIPGDTRIDSELFVTSGTPESTHFVDINPNDGSYPKYLTTCGNYVFFTADGGNGAGEELWAIEISQSTAAQNWQFFE